ncbi:cupin domain-containing protein [Chelativorans xinjiangense]|uniref:cupin domain-containing protein n=1 Tax=Chelativorans xinjiangense TaxID=2681485 RepID=UPI0013575AFE|nr:cupin domain-containing protein [Chelativorans xinjiangense]
MQSDWFVPDAGRKEFWTEERCFITELLNAPASPDASLAVARVEPGVTTQLHKLAGTSERYIIRKGQGIVEIDGARQPLTVGDQAVVPADAAQRITNTGDGDLEFYCLCTPRFRPDIYVNLEESGGAG